MLTRDIPEMMEGRDVMKMHQECLHPLLLGVDQVREAVEMNIMNKLHMTSRE